MPNPGAEGPGFFQQYGYIAWPVLGVLGGLVLLVGGYAIWRGPHRPFFPPCLIAKLRKNITSHTRDLDDEKHVRGRKRDISPVVSVAIPPREELGRQGKRGAHSLTSADAFKRQVVAARQSGMHWGTAPGVPPPPGYSRDGGEAEQGRMEGSPVSMSGTLVGSTVSLGDGEGKEMMTDYHYRSYQGHGYGQEQRPVIQYNDGTTPIPDSQLPRRRSSIDAVQPVQYDHNDSTVIAAVPSYPSPPPPAATAPLSYPNRRRSDASSPYHPHPHSRSSTQGQFGARGPREARRYPSPKAGPYSHQMKEGQDSHMW